ncbi:MAG: AAA family ATPase [Bacteriovoracaceae bacterium]|nr:AAA family ATPase [Bacteriovoracaceae bacterium]
MENALYLKSLKITNFATFEDQEIFFSDKFNAIIGETGSGKSLVLDALQLVLGQRSDKKQIRKGHEHSCLEATFFCDENEVISYLDQSGYPIENNEIIIKRIIYDSGKSKSFVNFQQCSLNFLTSFAKRFIDLVGQFENQKLLSKNYQLVLLDNFAGLNVSVAEYQSNYGQLSKIQTELEELKKLEENSIKELDFVEFQLNEIESVNPSEEEELELKQRKTSIQNYEKKHSVLTEMINYLSGEQNESNILSSMSRISSLLDKSQFFGPEDSKLISDIKLQLEDFSYRISQEAEEELDESELESILKELDEYQKLKRKYGNNISDILAKKEELVAHKEKLTTIASRLASLESEYESKKAFTFNLAKRLHEKRQNFALDLSKELTKNIRLLKMNGASVEIKLSEMDELSLSGITSLEIYVESNPGEGYFLMKDIVSGGELSRILLSIRQILSSRDSISIFVFDEIDTGMGGEIALHIGKALKKVSENSQVVAITHLPQIAINADKLIVVSKDVVIKSDQPRTSSHVREVIGKGILKEVQQMAPLN